MEFGDAAFGIWLYTLRDEVFSSSNVETPFYLVISLFEDEKIVSKRREQVSQ